MRPAAIGIDIGGTHLRAGRIAADGTILARDRVPSAREPEEVVARLVTLIAGLDDPAVTAIGIGVPGRVDQARRQVLSGGYVDLSQVELVRRIEDRFARPVALDNDAGMALLAEARLGAGRGARHLALLTIGTGIGGGIMEQGRILRGRATAGQLGHIPVDPHGPPCLCGRRGCVETLSSGTALGGLIRTAGLPEHTTASVLIERARDGDASARALLAAWAAPLRSTADALIAALDVERVILGGGLGREAAAAIALLPAAAGWYQAPIVAAELGDDAGIVGAGLAALDARPRGRRLVMVNGVPASGKSQVAAALAAATGWPVYALDTVKEPFLAEIGEVDRPFNRVLGRASYRAIFALIGAAAQGATAIVDAWFGFQPRELLAELVAQAGIEEVIELWCHAPADLLAARYRERAATRLPGHPGADYAEELKLLAARAQPMGLGPVHAIDTATEVDQAAILAFVEGRWGAGMRAS
ncbi:MAG: ROK family protein [Geminicoccaceae bacterium]